jgi:hypothetical protein
MDVYKNLPAPARIGIPVVLVLIVAFLAYTMMLKPAPPVDLLTTQDVNVIDTAKLVLDGHGIQYDMAQDANNFTISVPATDATDAAEALAGSGIKDRTGLAKKISCPAAPGFTATRAANVRADNCTDASAVQGMLLTAGAIAANVQVSQQENDGFTGPETSKNVVAQVFLPKHMKDSWKADDAAKAISRTVGTSLDRVIITDDQLQAMYDGSSNTSAAGTASSDSSTGSSTAGCDDISAATEVETKKNAVRDCYQGRIGSDLTLLLGGSDRYVLSVEPTIQTSAKTTESTHNSPGPVTTKSTQSGSGTTALDQTNDTNTSTTTEVSAAGAVKSLLITATLNQDVVTPSQELAVKRMLSTYASAYANNPAPTVTMTKFANGAGTKASNDDLKQIKKDAQAGKDTAAAATGMAKTRTVMPKWALALMAVLVIGVLVAVLVLWRRTAAMAAERQRLEESFKNEQRLFENFAQQNPGDLAADLNALFGAPAAPEPHARF